MFCIHPCLQQLQEAVPKLHQYKLWESSYKTGRLAAAPPPPNLLTVALAPLVSKPREALLGT